MPATLENPAIKLDANLQSRPFVTEEDIQKELDDATKKAQQGPPKESKEEFLNKFSGQAQPDGTIKRGNESKKEGESKLQSEPKKPSFTKEQIRKREEAERIAKELEEKYQNVSKERDELNQKIKELEEQMKKASSSEAFEKALAERDQAIKDREEVLEKIKKENEELKRRMAPQQLMELPEFQKDYVEPIRAIGEETIRMLDGDQNAIDKLTAVANLNALSLNAQSEEDRQRYERQRDELISEIADGLPQFRQRRFNQQLEEMIRLSRLRHEKMLEAEKTYNEYMLARKESSINAQKKIVEEWGGAYREISDKLAPQLEVPEEVKNYIESNGIKPPAGTEIDEKIAESAILDGAKDYTPSQVARVLRQGAIYGKVIAQRDALLKMVKELEETVAELKGSRPGKGVASSEGTLSLEQAKEAFFSRFQPPTH